MTYKDQSAMRAILIILFIFSFLLIYKAIACNQNTCWDNCRTEKAGMRFPTIETFTSAKPSTAFPYVYLYSKRECM